MASINCCPVCGGPLPELEGLKVIDEIIFWQGKHLRIEHRLAQILIFLWDHRGIYKTPQAIHEHIYGNDPNGGPNVTAIGTFICKLRQALRDYKVDINIESINRYGYRAIPTNIKKVA